MPDATPDTRRARSPAVAITIAVVPLLPVFYLLSFGLYVWLAIHGYIGQRTEAIWATAYKPIDFLMEQSVWFRQFIRWYLDLVT